MSSTADNQRRAAPGEYRVSLPAKLVAPQAKAAIELLIPPPITREALLNLFDGRANYPQAKQWRYGVRRLPHWAAAILDHKLEEHMAPCAKLREALPAAIGMGQAGAGRSVGALALSSWRLSQKQKAGG